MYFIFILDVSQTVTNEIDADVSPTPPSPPAPASPAKPTPLPATSSAPSETATIVTPLTAPLVGVPSPEPAPLAPSVDEELGSLANPLVLPASPLKKELNGHNDKVQEFNGHNEKEHNGHCDKVLELYGYDVGHTEGSVLM